MNSLYLNHISHCISRSLASSCTMGLSSSPDQSCLQSCGDFWIWASLFALIAILGCLCKRVFFPNRFLGPAIAAPDPTPVVSSADRVIGDKTQSLKQNNPPLRSLRIVSDGDLEELINNLDAEGDPWENVIDKRNDHFAYNAKCCKPKDGPLRYLSTTVFENCSPEKLRDFYMDNNYRKQWDKTIVEHEQLEVDETDGTEIGRTVKKFPFLSPREYILAWRLWEGENKTFYCFIKECDHPLAPHQKKYVRVSLFRSGWRIGKLPGRNACEIKMLHQEDAGLNVEMAKLAFAKGIWSYVCKMDSALRKYSGVLCSQSSSVVSAVTLIQKVPRGINSSNYKPNSDHTANSEDSVSRTADCRQISIDKANERKLSRRPSKKMVANGLIVVGGMICMSRGHSSLGAKIAMAYILTKLTKHNAP